MSRLLQLPRELRDDILSLVAFMPETPPPSPQIHQNDRFRWERLRVCYPNEEAPTPTQHLASSVVFQPSPRYGPINTTLALLLVNRQLHSEVQRLLKIQGSEYHLDVMDVNSTGPGFWVSWLCVPTKRSHIDMLRANLRLFDDTATPSSHGTTMARSPRFSSKSMSLTYRLFLASFLQHGPGAVTVSRQDYEARYSVKTFIINIQRPTEPFVPGPDTPANLTPVKGSAVESSADDLYRWFLSHLEGGQDHQDSRIIYQGIGNIEIRVDDELRHRINITDAFCRLPNADRLWPLLLFPHRWEFEAWVHSTIDKRKKLGLWDESVPEELSKLGEPECGLLIPGLWWTLVGDDWRAFTLDGANLQSSAPLWGR